jgi:hypothetical protein
LKSLEPVTKPLKLPAGVCRCIPTVKTIAKKLGYPEGTVSREVEKLLRLRWARKYKEDNKALFVIGDPRLLMVQEVEKRFQKAQRKKDGSVQLTEWRWLPLEKWTGTTLWEMVCDKLKDRGQPSAFAKARGRHQMAMLITDVGVKTAKEVGEFFAANYDALKVHFNWYGLPNPGLFKGFFYSIKDVKERGMPAPKGVEHDRGTKTAMAEDVVTGSWKSFED